jgi:hypothetical protein
MSQSLIAKYWSTPPGPDREEILKWILAKPPNRQLRQPEGVETLEGYRAFLADKRRKSTIESQ